MTALSEIEKQSLLEIINSPLEGDEISDITDDITKPLKSGFLGKKHSDESRKLMKERGKDRNAKSYKFIDPKGNPLSIYNLNEFCREHNLHVGSMYSVNSGLRKKHKGYTRGL